jgi:hypothetical protein
MGTMGEGSLRRGVFEERGLGGGEEGGSLALEGIYSGCMGWVHAPPRANAWLGVSLLAPADSLESKSFFAYKVESFFFLFCINSLLYMKNNQTKKIIT